MPVTSASRSAAVLARRALVSSAAAAITLLALAVPASAHTPVAEASCNEDTGKTTLEVTLTNYRVNDGVKNTVKITDGTTVVLPTTEFTTGTEFTKDDFPGNVEHTFVVDIKASDDPNGTNGWTRKVTLKTEACVKTEQSSSVSQPPPPPSSVVQPVSSAPAPTTTTTVAVGASANLAQTGASVALPIGIGALLLVGGATMLLVLRKRKA